jgi:hypothetical protein
MLTLALHPIVSLIPCIYSGEISVKSNNAALRAQDFQEALKETTVFAPTEVHFGKTLLIGKAASLAMHFKGLLYIDDYDSLQYAAAELGIRSLELRSVLHELEVVDFVRIVKSGDQIKRIDIRVPEFRDGYEELSNRWSDIKPSETEQAGVLLLNNLLSLPIKENEFTKLGLDSRNLGILKDVMEGGQLIRFQTISGDKMIYSPLAVDSNPLTYLQWTNQHLDKVAELLNILTANQGLPLSSPRISRNQVVEDAILTGVLMPVRIRGATGEEKFIFAPRGGLKAEERIILDKARAILASVRYGQNFAAGVPIKYPRAILEQLRDYKRFKKGHPDLYTQYSLLTEKLIGRPVKESLDKWNFEIIDTEENMQALDVAIDMLELGESPTTQINLQARKALLGTHAYLSPTSARPRLASTIKGSAQTRADILEKMMKLSRGII